jgi:hypothetical protein
MHFIFLYKLFFKNQKWTFINVQIPFLKKNLKKKNPKKNNFFFTG